MVPIHPPATPAPPAPVVLTHDALLWFTTNEEEGRITRTETQGLHRAVVAWLACSTRSAAA